MLIVIAGTNLFECEQRLKALAGDDYTSIDMSENEAMDKLQTSLAGGTLFSEEDTLIVRYLADQKALHDDVVELLRDIPASTKAIVYLPGLKASNKLVKNLNKLADDTLIEDELDQGRLVAWAGARFKEKKIEVSAADVRFLVEWVGDNQLHINNEIDKLIASEQTVNRQTIQDLTIPAPRTTIFNMLDAMVQGNEQQALKSYRSLFTQRLDAQYIISMICWQAHALSLAVTAKGKDMNEVAKEIGVSPFVLRKAAGAARKLNKHKMMAINEQILDVDYKLRNAPVDGERLVEQLIRRIATS